MKNQPQSQVKIQNILGTIQRQHVGQQFDLPDTQNTTLYKCSDHIILKYI